MSQLDMFGEEVPADSTDPVIGLQVELPDACPQCQGNVANVGQGMALA